jgi:hypothetical protein
MVVYTDERLQLLQAVESLIFSSALISQRTKGGKLGTRATGSARADGDDDKVTRSALDALQAELPHPASDFRLPPVLR